MKAANLTQKYKEGDASIIITMRPYVTDVSVGKYMLEREKLVKDNAWKLDSPDA